MFIDEAKIRVKAGDGGNGCMAFRREKFVPRGGPSGGDGGRGGDVVMVSSQRHNTLIHFRYNPEHKAQRGEHGMGSNCTGLDGHSITLQVPVGTSLYDQETGELVHDFQRARRAASSLPRAGAAGAATSTSPPALTRRRASTSWAAPARSAAYRLELKLLADVGLVGYPNAGKSTLISRISAARPKIADYPFTTLEPNLGVVTVGEEPDQQSFVVADMPGLIEGAHLGPAWARSSCATLSAPACSFTWSTCPTPPAGPIRSKTSRSSTTSWPASPTASEHPLAEKPMIVVATKIDAANPDKLKKLAAHAKRRKLEFHAISAVTGEGIDELKWALARRLREKEATKTRRPAIVVTSK